MKTDEEFIRLYKNSPEEFLKYFKKLFQPSEMNAMSEPKWERREKIDLFANVINIICNEGSWSYVKNLFLNLNQIPKVCELSYYDGINANTFKTTYFAEILSNIGLSNIIDKLSMESIYVLHAYKYIIYYILHYYLVFIGGGGINNDFNFKFGKNGEEINYKLYLYLYLSKEDKEYLSHTYPWITKKNFFAGKCVTKISEELGVEFDRAKSVIKNFIETFP